jgi:hypothetical protein
MKFQVIANNQPAFSIEGLNFDVNQFDTLLAEAVDLFQAVKLIEKEAKKDVRELMEMSKKYKAFAEALRPSVMKMVQTAETVWPESTQGFNMEHDYYGKLRSYVEGLKQPNLAPSADHNKEIAKQMLGVSLDTMHVEVLLTPEEETAFGINRMKLLVAQFRWGIKIKKELSFDGLMSYSMEVPTFSSDLYVAILSEAPAISRIMTMGACSQQNQEVFSATIAGLLK